jgi:predicted transcriptional regulator
MSTRMWENKDPIKDKEVILQALGRIVGAYLKNNTMEQHSLNSFIQQVFSTLCNLQHTPNVRAPSQPVVDIEASITPDYLICLEDGKHLKMLKRHLRTSYGLTPEQYRERWSLPVDYPMVAPSYAEKRSALARSNNLGHVRSRVYSSSSAQLAKAAEDKKRSAS